MRTFPTLPHRPLRLLMLWCVMLLQVTPPFIHAYAGTVHLSHAGFLHVRQSVHVAAAGLAAATAGQGAPVETQGMPLRHATLAVADAAAPCVALHILPPGQTVGRPNAGVPAPPPLHLVPPDHAFPLALAPALG